MFFAAPMPTGIESAIPITVDTTVIHNLTHHGNRPEVIAELKAKEEGQFDSLAGFLGSLTATKEEGETLLDRTMVLYGTCMGSANSHSNYNLPVLLAGGGFRHGQHRAAYGCTVYKALVFIRPSSITKET